MGNAPSAATSPYRSSSSAFPAASPSSSFSSRSRGGRRRGGGHFRWADDGDGDDYDDDDDDAALDLGGVAMLSRNGGGGGGDGARALGSVNAAHDDDDDDGGGGGGLDWSESRGGGGGAGRDAAAAAGGLGGAAGGGWADDGLGDGGADGLLVGGDSAPWLVEGEDTLRALAAGSVLGAYRKDQRFLTDFPMRAERFFQRFDDTLLRWAQARPLRHPAVVYMSVAVTGLFAIETGIAAPLVLFGLGFDGLATELAYLILITCIFSQIPKRFIWRYRPYMARRAFKVRANEPATTSSFPSRAVTCATVYSFMFCFGWDYSDGDPTLHWWMPVLVAGLVLLASFSRMNLGVHYPSDCLMGFLQGVLVCLLGTLIRHADVGGCASCADNGCYSSHGGFNPDGAERDVPDLEKHTFFKEVNWVVLGIVLGASLLLTLVSVVKPIEFWVKVDRVFGLLLPAIAFQLTFLCPDTAGSAIGPPPDIGDMKPASVLLGSIALLLGVGFLSGAAWVNGGKLPALVFIILFAAVYSGLAAWRLLVWSPGSGFLRLLGEA